MVTHTCPFCFTSYKTIHSTKHTAFTSDNLESQEQWVSRCCSTQCWQSLIEHTNEIPSEI